jgi:hypothetical protein
VYARPGQCLDPPQILGRDEVPRRPEGVRTHDQAVVHRPLHRRVVDTGGALCH